MCLKCVIENASDISPEQGKIIKERLAEAGRQAAAENFDIVKLLTILTKGEATPVEQMMAVAMLFPAIRVMPYFDALDPKEQRMILEMMRGLAEGSAEMKQVTLSEGEAEEFLKRKGLPVNKKPVTVH